MKEILSLENNFNIEMVKVVVQVEVCSSNHFSPSSCQYLNQMQVVLITIEIVIIMIVISAITISKATIISFSSHHFNNSFYQLLFISIHMMVLIFKNNINFITGTTTSITITTSKQVSNPLPYITSLNRYQGIQDPVPLNSVLI
ncbi:hypothetical protein ACTA71_008748 [Dictyostelium dimigraforme]